MTERIGPETATDSRQGIGSVEIAARVLFALEAAGGPQTLNQIAHRCDEQPSKIHRYLVSLVRVGLASQSHATGKYDLGPVMRRLGGEALRRSNDVAVASEYTARLSEQLGHSVNLTVWADAGPTIVRWDYGEHALSLSARVGATLPLLDSAAGQVFFAFLPPGMTASALVANLGDRTPEEAERLRASIRAAGYGTSSGGVIAGLRSIAMPVFTASDALPLAITVVFPRETIPGEEIDDALVRLAETTREVSAELGSAPSAAPPGAGR